MNIIISIILIYVIYKIIKYVLLKNEINVLYNRCFESSRVYNVSFDEEIKVNSEYLKYLADHDTIFNNIKILLSKYNDMNIVWKIINKQYFLEMTTDMLKDMRGEPSKIEIEKTKTSEKFIFIYGNKSSGDLFYFENDLLVKFKDR